MATIRRTSQPFQYVLAINRVFEEGEETLQDDDQERKFCVNYSVLVLESHCQPRTFCTNTSCFCWSS